MPDLASTPTYDISDFNLSQPRIKGPSDQNGYRVYPNIDTDDPVRYLLRPDIDFYRPWLANPPSGSAFIWPAGTQGFAITSQATLGVHQYIGINDIDVDVIYPDEEHIVMNGHFPGKLSAQFMNRLKKVILEKTSEAGKVLALPGIEEKILFVVVQSYNFTHDEADNSDTIAYSIDFVRVGIGQKLQLPKLVPPKNNPQTTKKKKGKSTKRKNVGSGAGGGGTLRTMASAISGNTDAATQLDILQNNMDQLEAQGIQAFSIPYTSLNTGIELEY